MRNKNISERLRLVLESKKLSIRSFSRTIHCADTTIGAILHEKAEPNFSTLYSILEAYPEISPKWLITGEGEMYVSDDSNDEKLYEEFYANHVKEITRIILKKLENYADSGKVEGALTSVLSEKTSHNNHEIQNKITPIKSK